LAWNFLNTCRRNGSQLPTIVITGRSDPVSKDRAVRGGAIDFIDKPVADDALLGAIARAFAAAGWQPNNPCGILDELRRN
jgi:two-component system response regulator FixJ